MVLWLSWEHMLFTFCYFVFCLRVGILTIHILLAVHLVSVICNHRKYMLSAVQE